MTGNAPVNFILKFYLRSVLTTFNEFYPRSREFNNQVSVGAAPGRWQVFQRPQRLVRIRRHQGRRAAGGGLLGLRQLGLSGLRRRPGRPVRAPAAAVLPPLPRPDGDPRAVVGVLRCADGDPGGEHGAAGA